jgi:hypothetical protein
LDLYASHAAQSRCLSPSTETETETETETDASMKDIFRGTCANPDAQIG